MGKEMQRGYQDRAQALFGIVKGSTFPEREGSAKQITDLDFPGYAVGGLSVGELANL